jgi:serine/threonine protein kinase
MPNSSSAFSHSVPAVNGRLHNDDFHQRTEAETTQPVVRESERSVTEWLDALANGECDRAILLRGIADSIAANPEEGWELLALVDQYYRRSKISAEDFHSLNAQLRALLIGRPQADTVTSVPNAPSAPSASSVPLPPKPAPPEPPPAATPIPKVASTDPADTDVLPSRRTVAIGDVLRGRYRIQGILGRGGMGTVYAALDPYRLEDADGGQRVAIKVLHTEIIQRPQLLEELRGEFQRLQSLSHPNIVRVHELDYDGELTFFTMEYLSGAPLSRVLAIRNAVALRRPHALAIIREVGAAVAYAHSRGIVHGDLNPGNIYITDEGGIRVLDFGASHRLRPDPSISEGEDLERVAVATPSYASCELLVGRAPDALDDIYSLACISYVLLTGTHPFMGRTALAARADRLIARRPKGLSGRQWRALSAGLQVDRKRRPDDLQAWLKELDLPTTPATLPLLPSVMGALPAREHHVRWATGVTIALVAAVGWWAEANSDLIKSAATALGTSAAQLWSQARSDTKTNAPPAPAAPVAHQTVQSVPPPAPPAVSSIVPKKVTTSAPAVVGVPHGSTKQSAPPVTHAAAMTTQAGSATLARIELAADTLDLAPSQAVASVVVHRRHSYHNPVSFSWWTESGTAIPGQDFIPVRPRTDYIRGGENEARLLIPIVADPRRRVPKSFYVVVGDPSDDATLGSRTITMVTILPATG